jgi:glycosyltransferase involved in cell wall biosynthesis
MTGRVIVGLPCWSIEGPCILGGRLVRGLGAAGWDAHVLLTEASTARVDWAPPAGPRPEDIVFECLPCAYDDSWGVRWNALIRYLEERAPCTYLMACDWRNNIVASRLSDRVRLIGSLHADNEPEYEQAARLGHYCNAIVAVSEILEFNLAQRLPHLVPRLTTIRNGVPVLNERPVRSGEGPLRVVYAGDLRVTQKRLGDLAAIACRLDELGTPFELTFIGDGALRPELESRLAPLAARRTVRFLGPMANEQVLDELAHHDVFVMTSEFEGLSLALLEAMSRACVPVVSDLATQSVLVRNGVNGYTVPIGDIEQFAQRLAGLAADEGLRDQLANAAFQTVIDGGYREEDMLASYAQLIDVLDSEARSARPFFRPRGNVMRPPWESNGLGILPADCEDDVTYVNSQSSWPDSLPPATGIQRRRTPSARHTDGLSLSDYQVLVSSPLDKISGVDVFSSRLVRELRRRDLDAKILGMSGSEKGPLLGLAQDVPVVSPGLGAQPSWASCWRAFQAYLEAEAPCVYVPNYDFEMAAVVPALSHRVKVVTVAHSDDPAYYELIARIGRASNAIVGVSQAIVEQVAALAPDLSDRLSLLPYGIDLPAAEPARVRDPLAPLRLVYLGRLVSYQKRVLDLIAIADELASRSVPFELTIGGDGPELNTLFERGRPHLMSRQLRLVGPLPHAEIGAVLGHSDVLVLPSAFEGQPLAVLEAMAHGVVPLVSEIRSGVPELIADGQNGLLCPVGDTRAFADRIASLHEDRSQLQRLSRAAELTIRSGRHAVDAMVDGYVAVFEEAIAAPFTRGTRGFAIPEYLRPELRWRTRAERATWYRLSQVARLLREPRGGT